MGLATRAPSAIPARLRYVFFDHGGHVAMAKRYRAYAQQIGLFKTLARKAPSNPNVDLLVGAVNVWCWDRDAVAHREGDAGRGHRAHPVEQRPVARESPRPQRPRAC